MKNFKTILVTGASGGIGKVLCEHLAAKGYNLILAARDVQRLWSQCNTLEAKFPDQNFSAMEIDFSRPELMSSYFDTIKDKIINGFVLMPPQPKASSEHFLPLDQWQVLLQQSFLGPLEAVKQTVELFPKVGRSKIVLISGISSAQVLSHYAASNVLRLMWVAQAKTLAFALGPKGIHFNTLSLGGVMTDKYKTHLDNKASSNGVSFEDQINQEVSNVPLRKYADPLEVSFAVEGLLSEFSDHMTGLNILCDGGFTRAY